MKEANRFVDAIDSHILTPQREKNSLTFGEITNKHALAVIKKLVPEAKPNDPIEPYLAVFEKEFFSHKTDGVKFNAKQLGLKVSANSIYGFLGAQVMGKFSLIEASMSVTSRGRELITDSSLYFEKHYGATTVYGDSVLPDEPLLLRNSLVKSKLKLLKVCRKNGNRIKTLKFGIIS